MNDHDTRDQDDIGTPNFYTLTGIGWGKGASIMEARANYLTAQRRNFPHLTDEELMEAWGYIWQAPVDATGFYDTPSGYYWSFSDSPGREGEQFDPGQRVSYMGDVPDHAQTIKVTS